MQIQKTLFMSKTSIVDRQTSLNKYDQLSGDNSFLLICTYFEKNHVPLHFIKNQNREGINV